MRGEGLRFAARSLILSIPSALTSFLVAWWVTKDTALSCCLAGLALVFSAGNLWGGALGMNRLACLAWLALSTAMGCLIYRAGL